MIVLDIGAQVPYMGQLETQVQPIETHFLVPNAGPGSQVKPHAADTKPALHTGLGHALHMAPAQGQSGTCPANHLLDSAPTMPAVAVAQSRM